MFTPSGTQLFRILLPAAALAFLHAERVSAAEQNAGQNYIELVRYEVASPEQQALILRFFREAAIPALNRAGIEPVGVFTVAPAELAGDADENAAEDYSVYVLTQFPTLEDLESLSSRLAADAEFMSSAREYLGTTKENPAYVRKHTKLMKAFEGFPAIKKPEDDKRYFELRTYEAHSELKAARKVDMFNEGEIDVFKKVGMRPVFFGQTIIGPNMPHLTYMLVYRDKDEEQEVWDRFRNDPDWHAMRDNPRYADTVSRIRRVFLVPAEGSQL